MRNTSTNLAWAAGLLDGEGAVMLAYSRSNKQVYLHIRIGMSDRATLDNLADILGGHIKDVGSKPYYHYVREHYQWNLYGLNAYNALKKLRPYLITKAQHADIGIAYYEECNAIEGNLEERLEFFARMRDLQVKGVHLQKEYAK